MEIWRSEGAVFFGATASPVVDSGVAGMSPPESARGEGAEKT